jgi:hypothetical protein
MIMNNIIENAGPGANSTKSIYMDEESSWMLVENNIISGVFTWGFMLHGGNNITMTNNVIDVTNACCGQPGYVGFYQDDAGAGNFGMANNVFTGNIVYSNGTVADWTYLDATNGGIAPLSDSGNLYYSATGVYNSGNAPFGDASPDFANPLFANPTIGDYTLQAGSPAAQVGFIPINMSTIGPIVP